MSFTAIDPSKYDEVSKKNLIRYYDELLHTQGIKNRVSNVAPFSDAGEMAVSASASTTPSFYYDIGQPAVAPFDVALLTERDVKSFYSGTMIIQQWFSAVTGASNGATHWIMNGPFGNLRQVPIKRRFGISAADRDLNYTTDPNSVAPPPGLPNPTFDILDGALFNLMKVQLDTSGGGTCTYRVAYTFSGVKIDL